MQQDEAAAAAPTLRPDYRVLHLSLTGTSLTLCPACGPGTMLVVEVLARAGKRQWVCDTS